MVCLCYSFRVCHKVFKRKLLVDLIAEGTESMSLSREKINPMVNEMSKPNF